MLTLSRATVHPTAAALWSRQRSGCAGAENGRSFTAAAAAAGFQSNRIAADDNPMKLMSIAMRPLSAPPFPIERIEEMTRRMGGDGEMNW